jgi:hypothetical protein
VASFAGVQQPPACYLNLVADPRVTIEVAGTLTRCAAHVLDDDGAAEVWPYLDDAYVDRGDLEDPPDRLDRAQSGEVIRARDRLLAPPAQAAQPPCLRRLVFLVRAVPQAERVPAQRPRPTPATVGQRSGAATHYHRLALLVTGDCWWDTIGSSC